MNKRFIVFALILSIMVAILTTAVSYAMPSADAPEIVLFQGNTYGQAVLVEITQWGQVRMLLYGVSGQVAQEEYAPLVLDAETEGVNASVCGRYVYVIEQQTYNHLDYYRFNLSDASFQCGENHTVHVPYVTATK